MKTTRVGRGFRGAAGLGALLVFLALSTGAGCVPDRQPANRTDPAAAATESRIPQLALTIPPFNAAQDGYVLLAWNDLGMHCISDADKYWILLPPANTLWAQLIQRGPKPRIVTEGVVLEYRPEPGFETPSKHTDFWKYAKFFFGKELPLDTGLAGKKVSGTMDLKSGAGSFTAELIPVVPYTDMDTFNPYPVFTIVAKEASTGRVLAETKTVAPVSTEMGCKNCHGGEMRFKGIAGLGDTTARNILITHDRLNDTALADSAAEGKPTLCQSCHGDPALGAAGKAEVLSLSAAMHGWHAQKMPGRGADACAKCHPNEPMGYTRCLRGIHDRMNQNCTDCHGTLEDHALSLLKKEKERGKAAAGPLMEGTSPRMAPSLADINPRDPWLNEPDCLNCHANFMKPADGVKGFNKWTGGPTELYRMRAAGGGVMCSACHGSTHAVYPARNPYGPNRDNIEPMQYQGSPYAIAANEGCAVCHREDMEKELHHPNLLRAVRNP
ncbi:MAG: cytochrome c [Thermodesulfobacteriota bacterium]